MRQRRWVSEMPRLGPVKLSIAVVVATGPAARGDNPTSLRAAGRPFLVGLGV